MKNFSSIILFVGGMMLFGNLNAQTSKVKAPSDAVTGYTYDFDAVKKLIIDRQINPKEDNKDVQAIIEIKGFPQLENKEKLDEAYKSKLGSWIEKNPNLIIETFKSRKEIVQSY